ncbi:MAG: DUF308 domain-containing protein, partial [Eubacterium sp.]
KKQKNTEGVSSMEKTISQKLIGLIAGILVFSAGLFLVIRPQTSLTDFVILIAAVLVIIALMNLITLLFRRKIKGQGEVLEALVNLGFAVFLFVIRFPLARYIPDLFAAWILINSIIRLVSAVTYLKDGAPNYGAYFVNGILTFIFSLLLLFNNRLNIVGFALIAGIYVMWYGITMLFDTFNEERTQQKMAATAKKMQRKLRITIPPIVGGLLPRKLLKEYDDKIASEDANAYLQKQTVVIPEKAGIVPYNVEILIHLSQKFMESFGHVDLILGDDAISYGNFDGHSYRLFGVISDGIIFKSNRERYLQQSVYHDHQVLIAYKVAFDEAELRQMKENFEKMQDNMYEWYCDTQLMEQGLLPEGDYHDIADDIYKASNVTFYKFKSGTLKTYFALDTNCVKVADSIFENTNFDKPAIPGIVTPGAYYQFLEKELMKSGTKVYEKHIYSKETLAYNTALETGKNENVETDKT